jgi:hypothetical protein
LTREGWMSTAAPECDWANALCRNIIAPAKDISRRTGTGKRNKAGRILCLRCEHGF